MNIAGNHVHNIWRHFEGAPLCVIVRKMFFFGKNPQVHLIITGIYKLPQKLPKLLKDLGSREIRKYQEILKTT